MELVSIIVPVYNAGEYLEDTLKSIIFQSYQKLEIILIDDGSKDNSGVICDNFSKCYSNVSVYHTANNGVSHARNVGIEKANGRYILFVDSDDRINFNYVKSLVDSLERGDYTIAICGIRDYYLDSFKDRIVRGNLSGIFSNDYFNLIDFLCVPFSKIYITNIIKKNKIRFCKEYNYAEDEVFNMEYYRFVKKYAFINEPLYDYFHRDGSLSDKKYLRTEKHVINYSEKLKIERSFYDEYGVKLKEQLLGEHIIRAIINMARVDNFKNFVTDVTRLNKASYDCVKHNKFGKILLSLLLKYKRFKILYILIMIRYYLVKYKVNLNN